jgi:CheY-like chemotaxis protein
MNGLINGNDITPRHTEQSRPLETSLSKLRILLAEDDLINQKVALQLLKRLGCVADVAANGSEVLAALERHVYHVILMDLLMPGLDGQAATVQIRNSVFLRHQPYIIALTASAAPGEHERCLAVGMDDFIAKPVRLEAIRNALLRVPTPRP